MQTKNIYIIDWKAQGLRHDPNEQQNDDVEIVSERDFWIAVDTMGVRGELGRDHLFAWWDCWIKKTKDGKYKIEHCHDDYGWFTSVYADKERLKQALVNGDDSDLCEEDGNLHIPQFGQDFWKLFTWN